MVAAVIEEADSFLVARRQKGVHLEGLWEFPGGKIGADESHAAGLRREIGEELGADVEVQDLILETTYAYEHTLTLYFYQCRLIGEARPLLGQEIRWVNRKELPALQFPPADAELIRRLTQTEAR